MTVTSPINPRTMPDGVILVFHIRYENQAERNPEAAQIYTYVLSKAGGLWYTSGAGQVPQAAGWGAVEKWLERDGRDLVRVEVVTGQRTIWPIYRDEAIELSDDRVGGCLDESPYGEASEDDGTDLATMAQPFEV